MNHPSGPETGPAIEICDLKKEYGKGRGVFDVSFAVNTARRSASWARTARARPSPCAPSWALSDPTRATRA